MKMNGEFKNLLKEIYEEAYYKGHSDGEWERNPIEEVEMEKEIEDYIFNNNIYLFEDYVKS
jgi:hypothetical protein